MKLLMSEAQKDIKLHRYCAMTQVRFVSYSDKQAFYCPDVGVRY